MIGRFSVISAITLLFVTACSEGCGGDVAVPRREAYPRIQLPAPVWRSDTIGTVAVMVNLAAKSQCDSNGWLTVDYPYGLARLYLTLTPFGGIDADQAVANRLERLSMNTGGAVTTVDEFDNRLGRRCMLMVSLSGCPTPVQFIAVAPGEWMLSGSALVEKAASAPGDSLRPVIDMLKRDIIHLLDEL